MIRLGQRGFVKEYTMPHSRRRFLAAANAATAICCALERGCPGEAYNITDNADVTLPQLFALISRHVSPRPHGWLVEPIVRHGLETGHMLLRPGVTLPTRLARFQHMTQPLSFSTAKATQQLGYQPTIGMADAIADAIA